MFRLLLPVLLLASADAPAPPAPPALVVKVLRPDEQLGRFLDLFEGTKWETPAKAYARWKMTAKPNTGFTKAAEAGFAILNREMVRELRSLDGMGFVGRVSKDARIDWAAAIPADDGTFDALATAMTLTDGAKVEDFDGRSVDRLGPPGAPLMMKGKKGGIVIAGSRALLGEVDLGIPFQPEALPKTESGLIARLDSAALGLANPLLAKQISAGLLAAGCPAVELASALRGESWEIRLAGRCEQNAAFGSARLNKEWLAIIPSEGLEAAFAVAIDPTPAFWNGVFNWIDRVEKADPARAGVAPARIRLALIAAGLGIRPEADLFPHLTGVSGFVLSDADPAQRRGVLALHFKDEKRAANFVEKIVKSLARTLKAGETVTAPDGTVTLPKLADLTDLELKQVGPDVRIGRGKGTLNGIKADAGSAIAGLAVEDDQPVQRFLYLSSKTFLPAFPPASRLVWVGRADGKISRDRVVVTGVRELASKVLESLLAEAEGPKR